MVVESGRVGGRIGTARWNRPEEALCGFEPAQGTVERLGRWAYLLLSPRPAAFRESLGNSACGGKGCRAGASRRTGAGGQLPLGGEEHPIHVDGYCIELRQHRWLHGSLWPRVPHPRSLPLAKLASSWHMHGMVPVLGPGNVVPVSCVALRRESRSTCGLVQSGSARIGPTRSSDSPYWTRRRRASSRAQLPVAELPVSC